MLLLQLVCCVFICFICRTSDTISLWKSVSAFRNKSATVKWAFKGKILARIIGLPCIYLDHASIFVTMVLRSRHWLCNPLWGSVSLSQALLPLIMEMYLGFPKHPCAYDLSLWQPRLPIWRWARSHFTFLSLRTLLRMNMKSRVLGREQTGQQEEGRPGKRPQNPAWSEEKESQAWG